MKEHLSLTFVSQVYIAVLLMIRFDNIPTSLIDLRISHLTLRLFAKCREHVYCMFLSC